MINNPIRNLGEQVKQCLELHPKTRNSDETLLNCVYMKFYGTDIQKMSAYDFLSLQKKGVLPKMESIGRARRKAQELYPNLRGTNYNTRLEEQAKYVDFAQDRRI